MERVYPDCPLSWLYTLLWPPGRPGAGSFCACAGLWHPFAPNVCVRVRSSMGRFGRTCHLRRLRPLDTDPTPPAVTRILGFLATPLRPQFPDPATHFALVTCGMRSI